MITGLNRFLSEQEKEEYVRRSDAVFSASLAEVSEQILCCNARVVMLSGPSASGKTTTAARLSEILRRTGKRMEFVSLDDFYLDRAVNERRAALAGTAVDYESAQAIDLEAFARFADELCHGGKANCPVYDFRTGNRSGWRELEVSEDCIVLMEGIQALYPEVERYLSSLPFCRIFSRPTGELSVGGSVFDGNELRLCRRIVRNITHRGSSAQKEFDLWKQVRDNEEKNIFPFVGGENMLMLNPLFAYEVNILKPYLSEALEALPEDSEYAAYAADPLRRFAPIEPISRDYLPEDSVFREFVF